MSVERIRTQVLIRGGGYAGLTAAMLLAWRGISCLVAERHEAASRHPKAHGVNRRSMELLRVVPGLEKDLFGVSRAAANDVLAYIAATVTGPKIRTLIAKSDFDGPNVSPAQVCTAGQDRVEPIFLEHARALGADVRFSTMLTQFVQDRDGVTARLHDVAAEDDIEVRADYMIAADGANGATREQLGIEMRGPGVISHSVSILFEADLATILPGAGFVLCYLRNAAFTGVFVSCDDPNRGQLNIAFDPAAESPDEFDAARCAALVRAALGAGDVDVKVIDILFWRKSALIASRMAQGRVFLAGDAAHLMPPVGGLGGQTALQDAADIAWKLAYVLKGDAGPALLDTYQAERLPVAHIALSRQLANYVERLQPDRDEIRVRAHEADYLSAALGYRYRSAAIVSDATDDGAATEHPLQPSGSPGTRLPHVELRRNGLSVSTHDLIGRDFVLFAGPRGGAWIDAARRLGEGGAPLDCFRLDVDVDDPSATFLDKVGLGADGALLARPDGYIAWRSPSEDEDPSRVLENVLARICCLPVGALGATPKALAAEHRR
ncbi:FAD-dependent oxidoreductase (plasmid) [Methylosinus sp. C49]|uniref:methanobactin biosynthesis FAD monooxygenase MbnF n=1 Tax=Methylosinus sp. C49 TaxID=2699395 RepID=UPI001367219E|nr:methanobactin biosynthesis FAD monooxygenase MbnF [Methylosinus sp. C49]BBU64221.1 FAD-dependent oxidoreductase [Methylosinus sp. C49]